MKQLLKRLSAKWNRWRRTRALRRIHRLQRFADPLGTIRQFIYLDTIALRSLYVSRFGPEDATTTITDARSREAELNASVGHAMPSVASLQAGGRLRSTTSSTMHVERVASEQSLFRDFLERELSAESHSALWNGLTDEDGNIPGEAPVLDRGKLIQIRIRLQADPTFRVASFANAISDLAKDAPEVADGLGDARDIGVLLRHLLIDQAPIDAELVDWGWDPMQQKITRRTATTEPLRLAALTEMSNYWLDVRRALFDDAECIALVRIAHDAPSSNWSPVKLFDAVKTINGFDGLDDTLQDLRGALETGAPAEPSRTTPLRAALDLYAEKRSSGAVPKFVADGIESVASSRASELPSATAVAAAFADVDQLFQGGAVIDISADAIAEHREDALRSTGLATDGGHAVHVPAQASPLPTTDRFIVGEVIALYW